MTDTFVLIGSADSIPVHEIDCQLDTGRGTKRLVIVDEGDRLSAAHAKPGVDRIIDLRRGNWDFFADHKTRFGFSHAVEMLLPKDLDKPWKGEGKRMVLTELLTREASQRRPSLGHLSNMADKIKAAEACGLAGVDTDDLDKDELDEVGASLTHGFWYDFHVPARDREMKSVAVTDWLAGGLESVLFVNGFTRGYQAIAAAVSVARDTVAVLLRSPDPLVDRGFVRLAQSTHPMAATHLVIAAAGIAPTCDDELDVAVQLAEMLAGFTSILQGLHRGAGSRKN